MAFAVSGPEQISVRGSVVVACTVALRCHDFDWQLTSVRTSKRHPSSPVVLMIDVGGGSVKLMVSGRRSVRSFESGAHLTADQMTRSVEKLVADWQFDVVSIGYPGPVRSGKPVQDPPRVGTGWVSFDYERAFGCPVRIINDAALQALAAYRGSRMLFVGLGTGLGSALIADEVLVSLELGWLHFDAMQSLLQRLADNGPQRVGYKRWRRDVIAEIGNLKAAFDVEEIVLGGGNAVRAKPLPKYCRLQTNAQAMLGAIRLWGDVNGVLAEPRGSIWEIRGMWGGSRR